MTLTADRPERAAAPSRSDAPAGEGSASDPAIATVPLTFGGRTVELADHRDYTKFYKRLTSGAWEPRTFETLARLVTPDVTFVDIGAWIGVTTLYAAEAARRVVAVEPDPLCREILRGLLVGHPNVELIEGALATEPEVGINAVRGFGSSETSVLPIGEGPSVAVPGHRLAAVLDRAGRGPLFVKIDIEGYEFALADEFAAFAGRDIRGLQIALHPQLLERSLGGPAFLKRPRVALAVARLARRLGRQFPRVSIAGYDSVAGYILKGVLFRAKPKGIDFVYEAT